MKIQPALLLTAVTVMGIAIGTDRARACGSYRFEDELVLAVLSDDSSQAVPALQKLAEPAQRGLSRAIRHRFVLETRARIAEQQLVSLASADATVMSDLQRSDHELRVAKKALELAEARARRVRLEPLIRRLQAVTDSSVTAE